MKKLSGIVLKCITLIYLKLPYYSILLFRNPNMAYTYPWTSAESSMRKARRAHVPVLPETLNALGEILEEQENLIQCNGHRFFQECIVDGNGKAHVMFACPEVINDVILNEGTELHADATFKVVPSITITPANKF